MAISDAQFAAFVKTKGPRLILAEVDFAYEAAGAPALGTVYLANRKYATQPGELPANQRYRDVIMGSAGFRRALDVASLGGVASFSVSELSLANADGALDFMAQLVVDGHEVRFYLGDPGWARADLRLVLVAIVERVVCDEMKVTLKLRDNRLLLDKEIKGDPVGGSGPDATKYRPILFGSHENVSAAGLLYDAATNEYAVISNYAGVSTAVVDVRDNGVSLRSAGSTWTSANTTANAGTDVVTHVAHGFSVDDVVFFRVGAPGVDTRYTGFTIRGPFGGFPSGPVWVKSVPTPDTVTFSLTRGGATLDITATVWNPSGGGADLEMIRQRWYDNSRTNGRIQLSASPAGELTYDIYNFDAISTPSGGFLINQSLPFNLAMGLAAGWGGVDYENLDLDAATAADAALDAKVGVGYTSLAVLGRRNLIAVLGDLLDSVFGWYGQDNLGQLTVGLLDPSGLAAATPTRTISANEPLDGVTCENVAPTVSRVNVSYAPNHTVQGGELSSAISDELRTKYSSEYGAVQRSTAPTGTAYATNKPLYHLTMTEGAPKGASMNTSTFSSVSTAPLADYADEIVADRAPHLQVFRFALDLRAYDWNLGEVVRITYPRFGLDAGKNCRLVGVGVDLLGDRVDIELLAQTTPDYLTASYP